MSQIAKNSSGGGGGNVSGPGLSVVGDIAIWDDVTGTTLADSGVSISTDGTLSANSNALVPTQQAVKTYADTKQPLNANLTSLSSQAVTNAKVLRANGTNWVASTASYPNTTIGNQLLYSSVANTVTGLASANSGVLTTSASGVPSIDTTNFHVLNTGVQMKGNNVNTAPPTGFIGESIRNSVVKGSAVSLTTGTPATIASITLTPGIWDVSFVCSLTGTLTGTAFSAGIATADNSTTGWVEGDNSITTPVVSTVDADTNLTLPSYRILVASNTTYYLTANVDFTVGSAAGFGRISATRVG